jgi:molybdopterin/thiamine biosynthesis adenylyltransferase
MRLSFKEKQLALRDSYLAQEEKLYATIPLGTFRKVKDWDDKGPIVIWEGKIVSPELSCPYKVQIHYGRAYPYRRPSVYPIEPRIQNLRHQEPTKGRTNLPGSLCLLPHNPDRWVVGMTCHEVVERAVVWFKAYENGTLDYEFAPPEIERFFPAENRLANPHIILVDSILKTKSGDRRGGCLLIPTVSGKFAFLYVFGELETDAAMEELRRLLGLILPSESLSMEGWLTGDWFDLDREPPMPVPLNSGDFLQLLKNSGRDISEVHSVARLNPKIVALRYPTPGGKHWLIFRSKFIYPPRAGFRKGTFDKKVREVNRVNALNLYGAYHINPETIFRRVSGYEVEKLQEKSCLLLGCGSIGSRVAELLIKSGIGAIYLVDRDEMRAGNVSRHVLGLDYIGQNKAAALKQFLHKRNPDAKIGTYTADIVHAPDALSKMLGSSDMVVSCLGNDATELFVCSAALPEHKTVLFCRSYLQGRLGQIFISRPPQYPACFNCASLYLNSPDCSVPRPPEIPYNELVGLDEDCGSAFLPASAVDLDLISLHGARMALALLQGDNISANYWLIRGREFTPGEYSELTGVIREPFSQHGYQISPDTACEICRLNLEVNDEKASA